MSAKISLIFTLLVSLFFAAPAIPRGEESRGCAAMKCLTGCCASKVCCAVSSGEPAPRPVAPAAPRQDAPFAALELRTFPLLYALPAEERVFVILDEARAGHALPPRLAGCIRLI